ncbi:Methyltransferase-like protein 6 [Portunus trituberculatus]|uniref:Methyltransferase-like protein 6 n=1 Tax=Portunus trituberculatus TaxID=210409 RepID=A0A5B7HH73_PORTR|nr:Methyltransferase-like protein 6 [Portunus trituberculatus]
MDRYLKDTCFRGIRQKLLVWLSGGPDIGILSENASMDSEEQNQVMEKLPALTESQKQSLLKQDARGLVPAFHQQKLEKEAAKNWDKFYKRNETRFFKDRHWTTREFQELVGGGEVSRVLLEVSTHGGGLAFASYYIMCNGNLDIQSSLSNLLLSKGMHNKEL